MRIHSEYMTVQTDHKREFLNITPNINAAVEKSGIRDGLVLVFLAALQFRRLRQRRRVRPPAGHLRMGRSARAAWRPNYHHNPRSESNAGAHLQSLLLNGQACVSVANGKLELGPWQQVIYAELDGQRPKRILIKMMGE